MKYILILTCWFCLVPSVEAQAEAPQPGEYVLITSDGNLHAQRCTITQDGETLSLAITEGGFLPATKSLQMFPGEQGFRVVLAPNQIAGPSDQHIDTFIMTIKPMAEHKLWGNFTATRTSMDSKPTCSVLLYLITPKP